MRGSPLAKDLPRLIYHRRALTDELLPRAVTGTSILTIRDWMLNCWVAFHPKMGPSYNPLLRPLLYWQIAFGHSAIPAKRYSGSNENACPDQVRLDVR